jgi:hypothetical protein
MATGFAAELRQRMKAWSRQTQPVHDLPARSDRRQIRRASRARWLRRPASFFLPT